MLRKIRLTLAVVCFLFVTLLFLDFTGTIHAWFGWLAKIQFLPALLALNVGVVLGLLMLTLLFGRVYCSVICPLGVFQDVISWISGKRKKKQYRFSYSPAISWLRYGVLALFVVLMVAGVNSIAVLVAPYSSYGRIASHLFAPFYQWGNNLLAYLAERMDSYEFYSVDVWMKSLSTFLIALVTGVILFVLAWKNGRTYCNTICPVGTVLGFVSRFALFRPVIDASKCTNCSLCSRKCKASCINFKEHTIDYSRCVTCLDCLDTCKHDAIRYAFAYRKAEPMTPSEPANADKSRRGFLSVATLAFTSAALNAQEKKVDGGLAVIEDKKIPKRATPIVPAGAVSLRNFSQHCTACQLCVSVCPNEVLRPSANLGSLMQPTMSYERGYCRPECVKCSEVCPAGAIRPISVIDKSSIRIGHAVWVKENCIPLRDGQPCDNCARHCPTKAIQMVPSDPNDPKSIKIPVVNEEKCIGCGACENLCPGRPFSALYVEGHENHSMM